MEVAVNVVSEISPDAKLAVPAVWTIVSTEEDGWPQIIAFIQNEHPAKTGCHIKITSDHVIGLADLQADIEISYGVGRAVAAVVVAYAHLPGHD